MSQGANPTPTSHDADTAHACAKRGLAELNAGDLAAAEASFRAAIAVDPGIAGFHGNLGRCLDRPQRPSTR